MTNPNEPACPCSINVPKSVEVIIPDNSTGGTKTEIQTFPESVPMPGLTKLEYFAGLAMQGWIACQHEGFTGDAEDCAKRAVKYAKALIEQLNKETNEQARTQPVAVERRQI